MSSPLSKTSSKGGGWAISSRYQEVLNAHGDLINMYMDAVICIPMEIVSQIRWNESYSVDRPMRLRRERGGHLSEMLCLLYTIQKHVLIDIR